MFIMILVILSTIYLGFIKKNQKLKNIKNSLYDKVKVYDHFVQLILILATVIFSFLGMQSGYNPHYFLLAIISLMIYLLLKKYESLLAICFVAFILFTVFDIGYSIAESESTYIVMKDNSTNQSYVVLNVQGARAIVAKVDLKRSTVYPEYQLIKFETDKLNEHPLNLKVIENLKIAN